MAHPTSTPTSTPTSSSVNTINTDSNLYTNNDNIIELVRVVGYEEMGIKQMMEASIPTAPIIPARDTC